MSLRFRKRIKIAKGIHLNLSKGGISASVGRPGATVNVGKSGVRGTAGLPGTGLSFQKQLTGARKKQPDARSDIPTEDAPSSQSGQGVITVIIVLVVIVGGILWAVS